MVTTRLPRFAEASSTRASKPRSATAAAEGAIARRLQRNSDCEVVVSRNLTPVVRAVVEICAIMSQEKKKECEVHGACG